MNYKKIIKNQNLRFKLLKMLSILPDSLMLNIQYYIKLNRKLNIRTPKRFTEWIQWYKAYYRNPVMHKCVDKYDVREYVAGKGLEDILIPNYGIFNRAEDINFNNLPGKFIIKTTDGSGGENVVICKDKGALNIKDTIRNLDLWLGKKDINAGREWAYTGMKQSRIIIEDYLENPIEPEAGIPDYKILCFGGRPMYIIYDCDRFIEHKRNVYDTEWNRIYVDTDCNQKDADIPAPKKLNEMLGIAAKLSEDFPFVRVDLYNIDDKIYFGELTFYPWSGYVQFNPDSFDFKLGELFSKAVKAL